VVEWLALAIGAAALALSVYQERRDWRRRRGRETIGQVIRHGLVAWMRINGRDTDEAKHRQKEWERSAHIAIAKVDEAQLGRFYAEISGSSRTEIITARTARLQDILDQL
jgi:hypothetical protein